LQLLACALLAVNLPAVLDFFSNAPLALRILVLATIALPLLQIIVPLPPSVWHILPGRNFITESLRLVDRADAWRTFSVDPGRTLLALAGTIAPLVALLLTWRVRDTSVTWIYVMLAGFGLASVLLGGLQLASDNRLLMIQSEAFGTADLQATFANRNSSGLFLDIALACLVSLPQTGFRFIDLIPVRLVWGALLVLGVLASHSRSSMALMLVPLAIAALREARHANRTRAPTRLQIALPVGLLIVAISAGVGLTMLGNNRVEQAAARFDSLHDARFVIWPDALLTVKRFWPTGGGVGTFDNAFQLDESLETLNQFRAGRAHNDYLEVAYEAGAAGLAIVIGWLAWIALAMLRLGCGALRSSTGALSGLMVLALQSIVDYPLRNQSLLCIAAILVGVIARDLVKSNGGARQQ
jgi:O-antigen ligase